MKGANEMIAKLRKVAQIYPDKIKSALYVEAQVIDWCKTNGLPSTKDYGPYNASSGNCKSITGMKMWKITDYGYCTPNQQQGVAATQDMKNCIAQYGPISVAVDASAFDKLAFVLRWILEKLHESLDVSHIRIGFFRLRE